MSDVVYSKRFIRLVPAVFVWSLQHGFLKVNCSRATFQIAQRGGVDVVQVTPWSFPEEGFFIDYFHSDGSVTVFDNNNTPAAWYPMLAHLREIMCNSDRHLKSCRNHGAYQPVEVARVVVHAQELTRVEVRTQVIRAALAAGISENEIQQLLNQV